MLVELDRKIKVSTKMQSHKNLSHNSIAPKSLHHATKAHKNWKIINKKIIILGEKNRMIRLFFDYFALFLEIFVFELRVFKNKILLLVLSPFFVVKKYVRPKFMMLIHFTRFFEALKPGLVLSVKAPRLTFERFGSKFLRQRALTPVEEHE